MRCGRTSAAGLLRAEPLPLVVNGVPDVEQREKIGLRIGEALVGRGRGVLLLQRTLARVLNAQPGGDDQQFARGVFVLRLEQHPAERRINRQPREVLAEPRQVALFVERAEFLQQRVAALAMAAGVGGWTNGKVSMSPRRNAFMRRMTSARLAR